MALTVQLTPRSNAQAVYLKQISELRQTQEELQGKLAETEASFAENEKALGAAKKMLMVSRTGSRSDANQEEMEAVFGVGSVQATPTRSMNDSSDAWLTLKQGPRMGGFNIEQREQDDERIAQISKDAAQKIAEVEEQTEAKVLLLQQELEAVKAAAAQEAKTEAESRYAEERKALEEKIKAAGAGEEGRIKEAEASAEQRIKDAKEQALRDIQVSTSMHAQTRAPPCSDTTRYISGSTCREVCVCV
jgi:hypothetical protein